MEEIVIYERSPEKLLATWYKKIKTVEKTAFLSALLIGFFTNIYYFTHTFANEDNYLVLQADYDFTVSGRWFARIATVLFRSRTLNPMVIGVICLVALAITAVLTVSILKIQSNLLAVITSALLITFPTLSYSFGYLFLADGYCISLLLSVLAVYLTIKYKEGFIFGGIVLGCSIGIYQSYLGCTMVLSAITIILTIINDNIERILNKLLKYFLMGGIGVAVYYIGLKLSLSIKHLQLLSYKGISNMGIGNLSLKNFLKPYLDFYRFFTGEKFFYVSKELETVYFLLIVTSIFLLVYFVIKRRIFEHPLYFIILIIMLVSLPLGCFIVDVIAPQTESDVLSIYQIIFLLAFLFPMIECFLDSQELKHFSWPKIALYWIVSLLCIFTTFQYFILDNTYYLKLDIFYQRTIALDNRILSRLERMPDFSSRSTLAVIGMLPTNTYENSDVMFPEIQNDRGLWGQYIGYNWGSDADSSLKIAGMINYGLGVPLQPADGETITKIKSQEEFKKMNIWPAENSVKKIGDIYVVKLSEPIKGQ